MTVALKWSIPDRSVWRQAVAATITMGAGLAYSLARRKKQESTDVS